MAPSLRNILRTSHAGFRLKAGCRSCRDGECGSGATNHRPRFPFLPPALQVWVVQRACSQSLLWRLEAEAVLEVVEEAQAGVLGRREVRFSLVEGDFKVGCLVA